MSSWVYQSNALGDSVSSSQSTERGFDSHESTSGGGTVTTIQSTVSQHLETVSTKGFASFICHVAFLEEKLHRGDRSKFFDENKLRVESRVPAGEGGFFIVDKATLATGDNRLVAIKTIKDQTG